MTPRTNARLAGTMFLVYIATGITSMVVFRQATGGAEGTAATLASLVEHAPLVRLTALLSLLTFFDAVVLGLALYGLTRDEDHDLALLALLCRVAEGVFGATGAVETLKLLSLATAAGAAPDAATIALGGLLLDPRNLSVAVAGTCFAVGSTIFCWLFVRSRSIPVGLAWLGVAGSLLVLVALPLRMVGYLDGTAAFLLWTPIGVFEVTLALWLLIKGVKPAGRGAGAIAGSQPAAV
ncbi:MAG TPA: DUF4386 domain-containing protein [bacterium]|nr:DUF4386 domain-containing protein [bacterium]